MAEIFVSYTSKDRDWAFWIGQELEKLGHVARIDAWEIPGGGNIMAWMLERLQSANHALCVISENYSKGPFASAEFQAALWAAQEGRTNFLLPIRIANCEFPRLLAPLKRCDLFGVDEEEAGERLIDFLRPAGKPLTSTPFPGARASTTALKPKGPVAFPGEAAKPRLSPRRSRAAISNIPVNVPRHFLGRDADLAAIDSALNSGDGRAAITALHGLRGVGKTVLAVAYAEKHASNYRATWWIRAETEQTMRADLVGLGVRLEWLPLDAPEELAVKAVLDRLRDDGDDILLIYDNANNSREFEKYAPRGGAAHAIVTSNAPDWRAVAVPVEIEVWPSGIGADFLAERTGHAEERTAALALSDALGGLPLAHEQAAAYCERVGVSVSAYRSRFTIAPGRYLDDPAAAPEQYYNGLTVAKTFTLAIDEAAKHNPAAEQLIAYAALLAPEPIPLYLFSEGRGKFSEPFASLIADDGLDEAVATLLGFALVDRETVFDERDPSISTDCIRLHRLIRQVAVTKRDNNSLEQMRCELIRAMACVSPRNIQRDPVTWPKARRLEAIALDLVENCDGLPNDIEADVSIILDLYATYRQKVLAAYSDACGLFERALTIDERIHGRDHIFTAPSLNNLGNALMDMEDFAGARPYLERALSIHETTRGADHPDTASSLGNLGGCLQELLDFSHAQSLFERALSIREKSLGLAHPETATSLNYLGYLARAQGDKLQAVSYLRRALAIREGVLAPDHPDIANSLNNLGDALADLGEFSKARPYLKRALTICEQKLGIGHPHTQIVAGNFAEVLDRLRQSDDATSVRRKFGLKNDDR